MQILFFDLQGTILKNLMHHKQAVNGKFYSEIQKTASWNTAQETVFFTSRQCKATFWTVVMSVLANFNRTPVKCRPYSPNLTCCDIYVFPTL